jgi:cytochrome c
MRLSASLALAVVAGLAGCVEQSVPLPHTLSADEERGRLLLRQYGCASCHAIPGVPTATANVGPPLGGIARRVYLAGVIPNTPENMVRWIRAPSSVDPRTLMPDMQVPEPHAREMVAYLYRLK